MYLQYTIHSLLYTSEVKHAMTYGFLTQLFNHVLYFKIHLVTDDKGFNLILDHFHRLGP